MWAGVAGVPERASHPTAESLWDAYRHGGGSGPDAWSYEAGRPGELQSACRPSRVQFRLSLAPAALKPLLGKRLLWAQP